MDKIKEIGTKYLKYIENLRQSLYRSVVIFAITFTAGFLLAGRILTIILSIVHVDKVVVATSSPFQFADVAMDIGFFLGIIITTPYLIYSFYAFIAPALTKKEKRRLFRSVPVSIILFLFGFFYGFFVLYYALELLADVNASMGVQNIWDLSEYLTQIFLTAALLGLVFEFPLLLTLTIKMGILEIKYLKEKRRLVYFLIFCLVSLLPPTDGLSLVVMSLPLILLYEATILLNNKQKYVWTRQ